jgi:hypothetical protein
MKKNCNSLFLTFFKEKLTLFPFSFFLITFFLSYQHNSTAQNPQEEKKGIRIMFYNVENLFHPTNDSLKNDDEFTEEGTRYWTYQRYNDKLAKIGKNSHCFGSVGTTGSNWIMRG